MQLMADGISLGLQQKTSQQQTQVQRQSLKLSQQQMLSVKLLAMGTADLRREIYDTVEKNPALEILRDNFSEGDNSSVNSSARISEKVSAAGQKASDAFQKALEAVPDNRDSLQDHLLMQLSAMNLPPEQYNLGKELIFNLDTNGYHVLAPVSLLDKDNPVHTQTFLEETISIINQLEPVGTCCRNQFESLFVQAKYRGDAPAPLLFLLDGHFDFLNPPKPEKVLKKINEYKTSHLTDILTHQKLDFTLEQIEASIEYLKNLELYPAREFSSSENYYVAPDVYVEEDMDNNLLKVRINDETIPVLKIDDEFSQLAGERTRITKSTEESEKKRAEHRFVVESVRSASDFIDSVKFRQNTLLEACRHIVAFQKDFFFKGPLYLKPLRRKDIAELTGVSEATISRMAKDKYLKCSQGLFDIGYFFTSSVMEAGEGKPQSSPEQQIPSDGAGAVSQASVLALLKDILSQHKNDKKPLSDQKLSDMLAEKGIKIARRTVAKYRARLNIESSYNR